jgi:hypothetical protein
MIRKSQLFLAVAALAGMNVAMAANCNTTQWGQGTPPGGAVAGAPTAGDPSSDDGTPNTSSRYSGSCGLLADAVGEYVQDGLPSAEPSYIQRFYVRPGTTSGEAIVFRAMADEATDYPVVQISYDGAAQQFIFRVSNATGTGFLGTTSTAAAPRNKWYAIETNFNRTAGTLAISSIRGNNGQTIAPSLATINGITLPAGDGVDYVQLGWISGGSGGDITVDAFESRRSTAIGHLKRSDANGSVSCNASDITTIANEIVDVLGGEPAPRLSAGQPDCNEDGSVNAADISCAAVVIIDDLNNDTVCGDAS